MTSAGTAGQSLTRAEGLGWLVWGAGVMNHLWQHPQEAESYFIMICL